MWRMWAELFYNSAHSLWRLSWSPEGHYPFNIFVVFQYICGPFKATSFTWLVEHSIEVTVTCSDEWFLLRMSSTFFRGDGAASFLSSFLLKTETSLSWPSPCFTCGCGHVKFIFSKIISICSFSIFNQTRGCFTLLSTVFFRLLLWAPDYTI